MNKNNIYRITLLICLFSIRTTKGWGSDLRSLPRLSFTAGYRVSDTVPPAKPADPKPAQPVPEGPVTEIVKPIIKQIPKSKKQLKPVALPGKLPVKTPAVVKPKVIIRRIGSVGL